MYINNADIVGIYNRFIGFGFHIVAVVEFKVFERFIKLL
jgi:hypothetical protein